MNLFFNNDEKEPLGFEGEDTFVLMQEPDVFEDSEETFQVLESPLMDHARAHKYSDDDEIVSPLAEQARRLEAIEDAEKAARGAADPTAVSLNRSEYRGTYIDGETGKRFRPGVPTEVGKIHAQRLLALRNGRLFTAC